MKDAILTESRKPQPVDVWALGSAIAVAISWGQYQSVLWAMLHGVFGWFYVIYYVVTR